MDYEPGLFLKQQIPTLKGERTKLTASMVSQVIYSLIEISADFESFGLLNSDITPSNTFITHRGDVLLPNLEQVVWNIINPPEKNETAIGNPFFTPSEIILRDFSFIYSKCHSF